MNKILVAGGRDFTDYETLKEVLTSFISDLGKETGEVEFELVSGGASGADKLAEQYAKEFNFPCRVFPANWEKYGDKAGPIRNSEMVKYIQIDATPSVVAFWDGKSAGTRDTIKKAEKAGIITKVVSY